MEVKYFKNGNINIKFDPDELKEINALKNYRTGCIENEVLATIVDSIELNLILADDVIKCAGNYNIYYDLYDAYTGKEYTPLDNDFREAAAGKTLKLYAHTITDEELKEYFGEYYG